MGSRRRLVYNATDDLYRWVDDDGKRAYPCNHTRFDEKIVICADAPDTTFTAKRCLTPDVIPPLPGRHPLRPDGDPYVPPSSGSGSGSSGSSGSGSGSGSGSSSSSSSSSGGGGGGGSSSSSSSSSECCNPECVFASIYTSSYMAHIKFFRQPDCSYLSEDGFETLTYVGGGYEIANVNTLFVSDYQDTGGDPCNPLGLYSGGSLQVFECCPVDITSLNVFLPSIVTDTNTGDLNVIVTGNLYDTLFQGVASDGTYVWIEYDYLTGWGVGAGFVWSGDPTPIMNRCDPRGTYNQGIIVS